MKKLHATKRHGGRHLPALRPAEQVTLVVHPSRAAKWPKYLCTLGLYELWRRSDTSVVTDRRVVISRGIFARSERAIPFDRVDDVTYSRRGVNAYCLIAYTSRGQRRIERIGPMWPASAKRFAREVADRS